MTDLESALAKLAACCGPLLFEKSATLTPREAAALLARLDAAERMAEGIETTDRLRINGAYGYVTDKVSDAIIALRGLSNAYRNPPKCAACNDTGSVPHPARIVGPQACPDCQYGATPP